MYQTWLHKRKIYGQKKWKKTKKQSPYTDGCTKHKQQYNSCMQFMM